VADERSAKAKAPAGVTKLRPHAVVSLDRDVGLVPPDANLREVPIRRHRACISHNRAGRNIRVVRFANSSRV
jgi:hypothetical protein